MMRRILCTLMSVLIAEPAFAHPIHTTLTKVSVAGTSVTFNIRAFADDFSATVAKFAGRNIPRDSSVVADDVMRYARAHILIQAPGGAPLMFESCGVKRANELYWLCFRVVSPNGLRGLQFRNSMLTELHSDQVNIVQTEPPAERRTLLFTRSSPFAVLN